MGAWIPPAYSPLRLRGIGKGLTAGSAARGELESCLREWYLAEAAVATASGTQALQLAMAAALSGNGHGGTIALPAFNCFDLVSAAVWVEAPVTFYDLDPLTLAPEADSLARAVSEADALVVANLFGFPLDWDQIREVADGRGIPVVEDAAQGMGAEWRGRAAGTFGDLSVLSFGRGKGWTGGSGGAVLARHGFRHQLPRALPEGSGSRLGEAIRSTAVWLLARPSLYGIPARTPGLGLGETHYRPPLRPAAISPFAAALALSSREASVAEVAIRRENAEKIRKRMGARERLIALPNPLERGKSGYLRFPYLPQSETEEDREMGIYRSYPEILPEMEVVRPLRRGDGPWPGSRLLAERLMTAPTHSRGGG